MEQINERPIQKEAFFQFSYGLYLLCAKDGERENGCIINTVMQVTEKPYRVLFTVNNENYTAQMIGVGDAVTLSVLAKDTPFSLIQHFGYQSGRDVDKFAGREDPKDADGIRYLREHSAAMISAVVESAIPAGTHTVYIASVTQAETLSQAEPLTYAEYLSSVKPKKAETEKKKGYVCKICGYVYEGEELPEDFVCPWCKHGADAFEPIS